MSNGRVVMREVESWEEMKGPGDYIMATRQDGTPFPIIVCPGCSRALSCSNHTTIQVKPLTIRASFLCQQRVARDGVAGTCGYHCMITNGVMEPC